MIDVLDALEQEYGQLGEMLASIDEGAARAESGCPGWTVSDVVLHLAQTEEAVLATTTGKEVSLGVEGSSASNVDELMADWVAAQRGAPFGEIRSRWVRASSASLEALRNADPDERFAWAAAPLKAKTLATTRLSEHWIHAQDIAGPLGIEYPDGDRLWQIARLAHRTIPYAFMRADAGSPPGVYLELVSPGGDTWTFGEPDAQVRVAGSASEFCRVAARRLPAAESGLKATGEGADQVLDLVRTYA